MEIVKFSDKKRLFASLCISVDHYSNTKREAIIRNNRGVVANVLGCDILDSDRTQAELIRCSLSD